MQQLTKSIGSFTWAMTLFGVQQLTNALGASRETGGGSANDAIGAMDEVTQVSMSHCSTAMRQTYEMGDKIQRELLDMLFRVMPTNFGMSDEHGCSCNDPMDAEQHDASMHHRATTEHQTTSSMDQELGWGPVPSVP